MPKTDLIKNGKLKGKETDKLASVKRLFFPIPAKTSKWINEISKFFKAKAPVHTTNRQGMSYTQASKGGSNIGSNIESILKIKEAFPTLKTNNINSIQQMINSNSKPKPHISMTTKGLSRKQIIIPINDANINNFMRESSAHVTNMNRALKNIKTDIMVNFV